ncbi:trans-1,2-dihydrobenzene-1,2-diol dehydrogenase-like protein [Aphelenchoides avenae]|nr:trans-1,2-dihydrobenzene-1,2-diol dehydrogenase-like protein [Aphelenchus avenae]
MVEAARERKLFLMEGYWSRFFPAWQHLRTGLESIGQPLLVQADLGYNAHAENKMDLLKGGGNLMATGCYPVMLATWVFGADASLQRVTASGQKSEGGVDTWGSITLEFSGSRVAHLFYTGLVSSPSHAFVSGSNGRLSLPKTFWCPTELQKTTADPHTGESLEETRRFPIPQKSDGSYIYPNSAGFQYEADHVFDCIKRGLTESTDMSLDESLKIAEILDEIRRQLGVVFPQDLKDEETSDMQ